MAISWEEYNKRTSKHQKDNEKKQQITRYPEMCDCCGHSSYNIQRKAYYSRGGTRYVLRYCENCNPDVYWSLMYWQL